MTDALTSLRRSGVDLLERPGDPGRTIMFLHGIGGRASSFADVMQRWPAGPRLLSWDQPGYGNSALTPLAWYNATDHAAVLASVVHGLGLQRVDLVGQSLGGLIAATYALSHPVRRLVLVSPAHGYGVPPGGPLTPMLARRVEEFRSEGAASFAAKRAPRLVHDAANRPHSVARVEASMASLTDAGHTAAVQVLAGGDLLANAARLPGPVLLISGADDAVTPLPGTQTLLGVLQKRPRTVGVAEALTVIPRAGHASYLEAPEAFVDAIAPFLEAK